MDIYVFSIFKSSGKLSSVSRGEPTLLSHFWKLSGVLEIFYDCLKKMEFSNFCRYVTSVKNKKSIDLICWLGHFKVA